MIINDATNTDTDNNLMQDAEAAGKGLANMVLSQFSLKRVSPGS